MTIFKPTDVVANPELLDDLFHHALIIPLPIKYTYADLVTMVRPEALAGFERKYDFRVDTVAGKTEPSGGKKPASGGDVPPPKARMGGKKAPAKQVARKPRPKTPGQR